MFCIHVSPVPLLCGHGRVGVIRIRISSGVGHGLYKKTAGPGNGNGSLQTESNKPGWRFLLDDDDDPAGKPGPCI